MPKQISFNISGFIFLTFCLLSSCLSCYAKTNGGTEITNTDYMTHNDSSAYFRTHEEPDPSFSCSMIIFPMYLPHGNHRGLCT